MSEENKKEDVKEERKPFNIGPEEPEKFAEIGSFLFTTSSDFGRLVYELFKVFDDFYNLRYEPAKTLQVNGKPVYYEPSYTLAFVHGDFPDDANVGVVPAFKGLSKTSNSVLRVRDIENRNNLAGKHQVTDNLKDVIEKYLIPNYYNNGKINWNQVCGDSTFRGNNPHNYNNISYTEIRGISLRRLAYTVYGRNVDGEKFDYTMQEYVPSAVNAQGVPTNYIIRFDRLSVNNVEELCNYYGFNPTSNGWIVNK
jgi:hypothetical protein